MGTLNLTAVTPDTPYIKKIKSALEKATGQSIPLVEIKKVQRKGGVSVVPIFLVFAGGQELTLFARASADVFKSELNGKEIVLPGDFSDDYQQTFDNAVSGIAKLIRESQAKVEQQNQKKRSNCHHEKIVVSSSKSVISVKKKHNSIKSYQI
jgi:hypothetical protein